MAYEAGAVIARIKASAEGFKTVVQGVKRDLGELSNTAKAQTEGFRALAVGGGAAFAAITVAMKKTTGASRQAENALMGLDSVARAFGQDAEEAEKAANDLAEDGLAPVSAYASGLKSLLSSGLNLPQAAKLMETFKDRAAFGRNATVSFNQAIENLAQSFKTEQSELGDASGMTENYSNLLARGAQILGKKVTELNNAERAQAKYLAILEASIPYEGDAARAAESSAGSQARLASQSLSLSQAIGGALEPAVRSLQDAVTSTAKGATDWVKENEDLARTLIVVTAAATGLAAILGTIGLVLPQIAAGFKLVAGGASAATFAFRAVATGAATAREAVTFLAGSFAPFLIGSAIFLGITALIGLIGRMRHEAALAKKDVLDITDIREAEERVNLTKKRLDQLIEFRKKAQSYGSYVSSKNIEDDPEVQALRRQLAIDRAHLAQLKRSAEPSSPGNPNAPTYTPPTAKETGNAGLDAAMAYYEHWSEMGALSAEEQIAYLEDVKKYHAKTTEEEWALDEKIHQLKQGLLDKEKQSEEERQRQAEETRLRVMQAEENQMTLEYENGLISKEQYLAFLQEKLAATEKWSEEYKAILGRIGQVDANAAKGIIAQDAGLPAPKAGIWDGLKKDLKDVGAALKGGFGQAVNQAGGLLKGGFVGALTALMTKTKAFQRLIEVLGAVAKPLIDLLDAILMPIIKTIANLWNGIIDALAGINLFGWRPFKGLKKYKIDTGSWDEEDKGEEGDPGSSNSGNQISQIAGPTRDLLISLLKPLDQLPNFFARLLDIQTQMLAVMTGGTISLAGATAGSAGVGGVYIENLTVNATMTDLNELDKFETFLREKAIRTVVINTGSGGA